MADIFRESSLGQVLRLVSKSKSLQYPEERPGFTIPWNTITDQNTSLNRGPSRVPPTHQASTPRDEEKGLDGILESDSSGKSPGDSEPAEDAYEELMRKETERDVQNPHLNPQVSTHSTASHVSHVLSRERTRPWSVERYETEKADVARREMSTIIEPQKTKDGIILVDWYTTDDQENPQNWSFRKKNWVSFQIWLYTFVVYAASAIYTPSEEGVMEAFGVGIPKAALGLSMYVLGYGIGPLLFSPMSEIAVFGRNVPYISSFALFVILSLPLALVDNYPGLLVLRFLTGFLGSPCLATGGATMQDVYSFMTLPYAFTGWVSAAFSAPALGPVISAFAVTAGGWRWSLWEILIMSGPVWVVMFISFPETSASNILLRRARRLRKLTGNENYKAQSEIDQGTMKFSAVVQDSLLKPFQIMILDPAVLFTNVYTSLIYGIYYSFFEAFPLVYMGIYGFNLGEMAVVFTCIVVGATLGIAIYCSYVRWYLIPDITKNGLRAQEHRLVPALIASFGLPIGLFIFAWTSRPEVHWIVSVIGITVFATSAFVLMQCVFMYLPLTYPPYAASLFAANDTMRSMLAAGAIIYAHPLFINLGIARAVTLLAGLACGGVIGIWLLWFYGAKLRARSKFAQK